MIVRARSFTRQEEAKLIPFERMWRSSLEGKKAAIYVGGGFKAISLIRQFNSMGIETVVVGTQTGKPEDYEVISQLVGPKTVILDDANPAELETFMREKGADILVGGVKERPLAYKLLKQVWAMGIRDKTGTGYQPRKVQGGQPEAEILQIFGIQAKGNRQKKRSKIPLIMW